MVVKKNIRMRMVFTVFTVLIICFIFSQSLMNGEKSGGESGKLLSFINSLTEFLGLGKIITHNFLRKFAHFTEFAVLSLSSFLMYRSYNISKTKTAVFNVLTFVLVAVSDEFIQYFVPERACQFTDVLIDSLGGLFATAFATVIIIVIDKKQKYNI